MSPKALKPIPSFQSDEEMEAWFDTADFSEYDLVTGFRPFSSEFRFKDARVNMRIPAYVLERLKAAAKEEDMPYQRLIRDFIMRGLAERARRIEKTQKKAS